jgi:uncharacterized repeat protein (TIGR01451 family)
MNKIYSIIILFLLLLSFKVSGQYDVIYQNDFRNYQPNSGWIMLDLDGNTATTPGRVAYTYGSEVIDYGLGVKVASTYNKAMISPVFQLGTNPYLELFSNFYGSQSATYEYKLYVTTNVNDTTLSLPFDTLANLNISSVKLFNLEQYANSAVRFIIKFNYVQSNNAFNLNRGTTIDDFKVFNKTRNAYIPDVCFRSYLQSIIPQAFIEDSLNYVHQDVINLRRIVHPNSCIKSLEGLQYFPFLRTIITNNNLISYIPPNKINHIDSFFVQNNYLEIIPDMPWARKMDFSNNVVRKIPNFSNQNVGLLNCYSNQIYDCLPGSNRFADGSLVNNVRIHKGSFFYYDLVFNTYPASYPYPIPPCSQENAMISGKVYYDINENFELDQNDYILPTSMISIQNSPTYCTNFNGEFNILIDSGDVQIEPVNLPNFVVCSNPLDTIVGSDDLIEHDFRLIQTQIHHDVEVSILSAPQSTVNTVSNVTARVRNYTYFTENVTVKIPIPNQVQISNPGDLNIIGDTIIWQTELLPFAVLSKNIFCQFDSSAASQNVIFTAAVTLPIDNNLVNNFDTSITFIRPIFIQIPPTFPTGFPYDPNNKLVDKPVVDSGFYDFLVYNINFENIGTGNASHVIVRDILPNNLDKSTFEFLGSTHPCVASFCTENTLQFSFYPIVLTPTSISPDSSTGSLWFRIKPTHPLSYSDTIYNSASIVFDTQAPIVTNRSKVYVDDTRIVDFSHVSVRNTCEKDSVQFLDLSTGFALAWEWNISGPENFQSTERYPLFVFQTQGVYDVQLITHWAERSDTIYQPAYYSFLTNPPSEVSISGDTVLCTGGSVLLTADALNANYNWSNGTYTRALEVTQSGTYQVEVSYGPECISLSSPVTVNFLPVPTGNFTISNNGYFCDGDSAVVVASDTAVNYLWSDGTTTNYISRTETDTISFTVENTFGCAVQSDEIVLEKKPLPAPNILSQSFVCIGQSSELSIEGTYQTYLWSTGETSQVITKPEGVYQVSVTDQFGCVGISEEVVVENYPQLELALESNLALCVGDTAVIGVNNDFESYQWSNGDTLQQTRLWSDGIYNLTVIDTFGCIQADSIQITSLSLPQVAISGALSLCEGDSIELAVPTGFASYLWSNGSNGNQIFIANAGVYSVTILDSNGCRNSDSTTISVNTAPEITISGPETICPGESVLLSVNDNFSEIQWNTGDQTQSIEVNTEGIYTATITDENGCSNLESITLSELPIIDVTISSSISEYVCQNYVSEIQLEGTPTGGVYSGEFVVGSTLQIENANIGWNYFQYAYTNEFQCTAIAFDSIFVDNCLIQDFTESESPIKIYPIPFTNQLNIDFDKSLDILNVKIYNAIGQLLIQELNPQKSNDHIVMQMPDFPSGVYLVVIESASNNYIKKIIKQ